MIRHVLIFVGSAIVVAGSMLPRSESWHPLVDKKCKRQPIALIMSTLLYLVGAYLLKTDHMGYAIFVGFFAFFLAGFGLWGKKKPLRKVD